MPPNRVPRCRGAHRCRNGVEALRAALSCRSGCLACSGHPSDVRIPRDRLCITATGPSASSSDRLHPRANRPSNGADDCLSQSRRNEAFSAASPQLGVRNALSLKKPRSRIIRPLNGRSPGPLSPSGQPCRSGYPLLSRLLRSRSTDHLADVFVHSCLRQRRVGVRVPPFFGEKRHGRVQTRFHRPQGDVKDFADLLVRKPMKIRE